MLRQYYRAFYKDNSGIKDISASLQHAGGGAVLPFEQTSDYLYIGQYLPFNNFFFLADTANENDVDLKVEYFDGRSWREMVDLIDSTEGFQKTGVVQFTPNRQYAWSPIADTSTDLQTSEDLQDLTVYDLYWIRVSSSAAMNSDTQALRLGYAFCLTEDLKRHEPEIDNYLNAWGGESKTDWYEQIMTASEEIVSRLKEKQLIIHPGQVLRFDDVSYATQMKTLIDIYAVLGPAFADKAEAREKELKTAMNVGRYSFDQNRTGAMEPGEYAVKASVLER